MFCPHNLGLVVPILGFRHLPGPEGDIRNWGSSGGAAVRRTKAARASQRERLLKRREERANRTCGECTACTDCQCLWLRGVGEKDDRPDSTGIILTGGEGKGAIYAAPIERMGPCPTEAQYLVLRRLDDRSAGRVLYWDTGLQNPEGTGTLWDELEVILDNPFNELRILRSYRRHTGPQGDAKGRRYSYEPSSLGHRVITLLARASL